MVTTRMISEPGLWEAREAPAGFHEVALVFDPGGKALYWHDPGGASAGALPDSRDLWEVLWSQREKLGGVAHTHPGGGIPGPSHTDLTTWAAVEAALGKRLIWPIVTWDCSAWFGWHGPGRLDYDWVVTDIVIDLRGLRRRSAG